MYSEFMYLVMSVFIILLCMSTKMAVCSVVININSHHNLSVACFYVAKDNECG